MSRKVVGQENKRCRSAKAKDGGRIAFITRPVRLSPEQIEVLAATSTEKSSESVAHPRVAARTPGVSAQDKTGKYQKKCLEIEIPSLLRCARVAREVWSSGSKWFFGAAYSHIANDGKRCE